MSREGHFLVHPRCAAFDLRLVGAGDGGGGGGSLSSQSWRITGLDVRHSKDFLPGEKVGTMGGFSRGTTYVTLGKAFGPLVLAF